MTNSLPPLSSLRAFEAVVRLGSVSRAAEELGRTHGAVSKQLRTLREHSGLSLLEKSGTGLKPTAAGEALAEAVSQALENLADRYAELRRAARSPGVQVACSATFAMRWLVPHLAGFARAHPDVSIRLSMTSAREMREDRDADLAVLWDRRSYPPEDQARAIRLADAAFGPVIAPGYPLARKRGGKIVAGCRIGHDFTSRAWDLWAAESGLSLTAAKALSFPHTHLCIEAAVAGMGVALVERRLVTQELDQGRLIAPLGFTPFADGFVAIPSRRRVPSAQARLFLRWLATALGKGSPPP